MDKRAFPVATVARTWFKIGKACLDAYSKAVEENSKDDAGFHRDFEDLINQLPEPPAGLDESVAPT